MNEHPIFEIVTTTAGATSIRNKIVGEIMHNPVGPWVEANVLYVDQPQLSKRISEQTAEELVVYDVGLGAAANALAVLHCAFSTAQLNPSKKMRSVRLVSFEKDLELLRFALAHASYFEHFSGYEKTLTTLLNTHLWHEQHVTWELHHGEFLDALQTEMHAPHVILFDPYSPQVNKEMWTTSCFEKLRARCREEANGGTTLYTYSQSTPVRAGLLKAGFFVGEGHPTGFKNQTTQAATSLKLLEMPLGTRWLKRWKESHTPYPFDCKGDEQQALVDFILAHPQFTALNS